MPDSLLRTLTKDSLVGFYKNKMGENLQLYTGQEYIRNGQRTKGFPFFGTPNLTTGSVFYNDQFYSDVPMYFDLTTNDVIINNFANNGTIRLVPEKIKYFSLLGHHFVHLFPDQQNSESIHDAFYDLLLDEKIAVFAKREKQFKIPTSTEEEIRYDEYNYYFLRMKNVFYKIEDEHQLLDVLKDKKDQLKKYIKANKLSFKKHLEEAVVKTTEYYNQLTN
jgi:hypothetical protein